MQGYLQHKTTCYLLLRCKGCNFAYSLVLDIVVVSPPTNFVLVNSTNCSVLLSSWDMSDSNMAESYLVYCRVVQNQYYASQEPTEDLKFELVAVTTVNMATITKLQPFTTYQCHVRVACLYGKGPASNTDMARTSEGHPSAPTNFTAPTVTTNTITLSWSRPGMPNGIILLYSIDIFSPNKSLMTFMVASDEAVVLYPIENLFPYTQYLIMVSASTSVGMGEQAQINILTHPIREPGTLTTCSI